MENTHIAQLCRSSTTTTIFFTFSKLLLSFLGVSSPVIIFEGNPEPPSKGPGKCRNNSPSAPHSTGMTQILRQSEAHSDCSEMTQLKFLTC